MINVKINYNAYSLFNVIAPVQITSGRGNRCRFSYDLTEVNILKAN